MVVPYGEPNSPHFRKNAFDAGEYGIGNLTNSLTLGCDCLGEIRYFDAVTNNTQGGVMEIPNAICMHEEDFGILWKHVDWRTGETEVRRSRRLVVLFHLHSRKLRITASSGTSTRTARSSTRSNLPGCSTTQQYPRAMCPSTGL